MYKNQLQELAQRSCFNLPSYACIREGPDHSPRFKATVNFNGEMFESPAFFSTLRQAEHAAAEVALNTLAERGPSKTLAAKVLDETGVYKNLLQETAHRAGLNLPVYTTVRSGPGHVPVFSCTVELAGMTFTGEPAKTKKQAQKNAAITAWSALKQMSQGGSSSSSPASSGCHEEQEQVIVARFLANLNPPESITSPQSTLRKGDHSHRSYTFSPSTSSFNTHYQNWASSNLPPETAIYYMWMQEQVAEQQRRLIPFPVPVSPVPPPGLPWVHSMLHPSHPSLALRPGITSGTTNSSLYFSNQLVPNPTMARSMVTIQEVQDEKQDDSEPMKDEKQESSPETTNVTSVPLETREIGSSQWTSGRSRNPLGFESSRPNIRLNQAVRPTQKNFPSAPRMRSGVSSYSAGPGSRRMQGRGLHSPFMAPAVQIRSVVPVGSAAPSGRMTGSNQERPPSDDATIGSTGDISVMSSKLGNFHL